MLLDPEWVDACSVEGKADLYRPGDKVRLVTAEILKTFREDIREYYADNVPDEWLGCMLTIAAINVDGNNHYYSVVENDEYRGVIGSCIFYDEDFMPRPIPREKTRSLPDI